MKQIIVTLGGTVYLRQDRLVKRVPFGHPQPANNKMDNKWREFFGGEPIVGERWSLTFNDIEFPDRLSSSVVQSVNTVPE